MYCQLKSSICSSDPLNRQRKLHFEMRRIPIAHTLRDSLQLEVSGRKSSRPTKIYVNIIVQYTHYHHISIMLVVTNLLYKYVL